MDWKEKAIKILRDSLYPIPSELNELDWKSGLSDKSERIAQHISAFANMKGGGILVYGVNNDGTCFSITKDEIDKIVQTLGNIAHNNLVYSIPIEHSILDYEGYSLLFYTYQSRAISLCICVVKTYILLIAVLLVKQ